MAALTLLPLIISIMLSSISEYILTQYPSHHTSTVWKLDLPMMVILFHGSQPTDKEGLASNHFIVIAISPYSKMEILSKGKRLGVLILKKELK
jgi:hypothetical protein